MRFGPFGKVANAVRESVDDIRQWVFERPLRVGAMIAAGYGILVVVAKSILVALMQSLYSWYLTVAVGAILASIVAAPHLWLGLVKALRIESTKKGNRGKTPPSPDPEPPTKAH